MEFLTPPEAPNGGFDPSVFASTEALIAYGMFAALVIGLVAIYFLLIRPTEE